MSRKTTSPRRMTRRLTLEPLEDRCLPSGTWTHLTNLAPEATGTMMLLPDGTVMTQGAGINSAWHRLTADVSSSFVNGSWSALASMGTPRLYFGSNVLPSDKVLVLGGEYTSAGQVWTNTGEIYDSVANSWVAIPNFPQSQYGDDPTVVLPNGQILAGYLLGPQTYLYDPASSTWTSTGTKLRNDQSDEETWTMLPDGSVLSYDVWSSIATGTNTAQRYVPATNSWVDAGALPVSLSSAGLGYELGPAFLLPDGRVFQIGANSSTAIYTPSTNTWVAGPIIPNGKGSDDAPGAVLPNGHVIFAADTPLFNGPTQLFEFDPIANTITQMTVPAQLAGQLSGAAYTDRMVMLPSGQVLFGTGTSSQLWAFTPDGAPSDAWRPTVTGITSNGGGTYTLTGTQLTGISEGASYGDDAEMSSNYPIVQLTDSAGNVTYARTSNWTPGVATGSTSTTTQFTLPNGLAQATYSLTVIANGIASLPVSFSNVQNLAVLSSTPAAGSVIATPATSFVVTFNEPIQPATLQAADLTVNGIVANGVTLDTVNQTATFTFTNSPVTAQGVQSMRIAANAITGQDGTGILAFHATFRYDALTLAVASTNPAAGGVFTIPASSFTFDVTTNEPIDPAKAGVGNLNISQGTVTSATVLPGNTTIEYTLTGLTTEGTLTVSIPAGQLKDQYDNPGFTSFSATYQVDVGTKPYPTPLAAAPPLGSLVYDPGLAGLVNFSGDTDNFTLNLNAGQTLSVLVAAVDPGLQPTAQVLDPTGTLIARTTAAAAGQNALLQTVPVSTGGTYTIVVGGASSTTGAYTVQATLNAALETEEALAGVTNNTPETAQDLDPTFLTLTTSVAQAQRGAVLGTTDSTLTPDYYSFSVNAGQTASLTLTGLAAGNLGLDLIDSDGATVLISGQAINNFVFSVAGTYYARVTGDASVLYSLVVTTDAAFDTHFNVSAATAQDITGTHGVLGGLAVSNLVPPQEWYQVTLTGSQTALQLETNTPGSGSGQFVNILDPHLQLYDAANNLIATGILLADGRDESLSAQSLTPAGTYFIRISAVNNTTGEYYLGMTPGPGITPNIVMGSAQFSGGAALTLTYQVSGVSVGHFRFGFYSSADTSFDASDTLLSTVQLADQSQLTVGSHTLTLTLGNGPGQVALPGAGLAIPSGGYYLLAEANDNSAVTETTAADNAAVCYGAYHVAGGNLLVQGRDGNDTITITIPNVKMVLTLNGSSTSYAIADVTGFDFYLHGGNDSVTGRQAPQSMRFFAGPGSDTVAGGTGANTLVGPDLSNAWVLTGGNAGTLNGATFANIGTLTGGALNDTFTIQPGGSLSGSLDGGGGANTLDYSAFINAVSVNLQAQTSTGLPKSWANIGAVVGGSGTNTLTGGNAADTWIISSPNAGTVNGFAFSAFQNLTGGTGNDTFDFISGGSVAGKIDGKGGTNSLDFSGGSSAVTVNLQTKTAIGIGSTWANIQSVVGTGTTDSLIGANAANTWTVTGLNAGNVNGTFTFAGFVNLTGGSGNDTFKFADGAGVAGVIDGKAGTNTLDYSAYTSGIYVNLLTASATGAAGIANIRNVTGGLGNDVLVGDNNANVFKETGGRNLIIGEGGKDTLTGASGGDILIGGRTSYDTNVAALDALLATWDRTDLSYGDRVAALQTGVSYVDGSGTQTAALTTATVFDDGASDILKGGSGLDWFFAHLAGTHKDTIKNKQAGEIVTSV